MRDERNDRSQAPLGDVEPLGRRLADEPLRLLPLYSGPPRGPASPAVRLDRGDRPFVVLRVGRVDASRVDAALEGPLRPAALIVNLTEQPEVIRTTRRSAQRHGLAFGGDPALYRMALPHHTATPGLRKLRYRPPDGEGPWTAEDLRAASRRIARDVIEEQQLAGADVLIGAAVAVRHPHDPAVSSLGSLLSASIAAALGWGGAPLLAPVIAPIAGFTRGDEQEALVRALGSSRPQAWLPLLDGVNIASPPGRLLAAAQLMDRLRALGQPVVAGRAGGLRRLWLALGFDGVEIGLGRLERFELSDHKAGGGPGHNPPRWEVPELLCSVPRGLAERLMRVGGVPCPCPTCSASAAPEERLQATIAHNAWVLARDVESVASLEPAERLALLEGEIRTARAVAAELDVGVDLRRALRHLTTWPQAIEAAREHGLAAGEQAA